MKSVQASEARKRLSALLSRVEHGNERIAIARHRRHVAVLISWEDLDLLEMLEHEVDAAEARIALSESHGHPLVAWEKVMSFVGLER